MKTRVAALGLALIAVAGSAWADDTATELTAKCSHGEDTDECEILEAQALTELLEDLEILAPIWDQENIPIAITALGIDDPRVQLAALQILARFEDELTVQTALASFKDHPNLILRTVAATILRSNSDDTVARLSRMHVSGHAQPYWTSALNLFSTPPVADPVSVGVEPPAGATALTAADYFDDKITAAGYLTTATPGTLLAPYASLLGGKPEALTELIISVYTACAENIKSPICALEPIFSGIPGDDESLLQAQGLIVAGTPAKLILAYPDLILGKTVVRIAWGSSLMPDRDPTSTETPGAGGSGGATGGTGGSRAGSGGSRAGTGGSTGTTGMPAVAKKSDGCGCALGGRPQALSVLGLLGLLLVVARARKRK